MKTLHIPFEDEEYEKLISVKGKKTWREFIIEKLLNKEEGSE